MFSVLNLGHILLKSSIVICYNINKLAYLHTIPITISFSSVPEVIHSNTVFLHFFIAADIIDEIFSFLCRLLETN